MLVRPRFGWRIFSRTAPLPCAIPTGFEGAGSNLHGVTEVRSVLVALVLASSVAACSSSSDSASCENVTNQDLLGTISATQASAVKAGHDLGNNPGYYLAKADGALWVTSWPPVSNGSGGLVFPMNPQARLDAPDVGVDVNPNAPILKDFSPDSSAAKKAVSCAAATSPGS
jgi:hypothetical protein